ncbi:MAG: efflux RND transporter permease subunit [Alphaproteobacteria bacterium]|nr:efflux RND transporter permease subunit [Alphaproteobacteria bacterium]
MLKFFVRRPITTLMFVLVWVVLGLVSFPNMNIERAPSVDFPMVTATFVYPGATPEEIESQIIKRAEDAISEVSELKNIISQAYENSGFVMAEFNLGVDVNDKATEIKTKLDSLISEFPDDMDQPVVEKLNPLQESVVDIVLRGADARDLEEYVDDFLSNKITAINGVASVSVFGGRERAIRIALNPDQMAARGITIMDVVSALGSHNLNVPGGKIETSASSSNVRFIGEFASISEIENLHLTTVEGNNFTLSDVAQITDAARDIENGARYNGESVVVASVVKSSDGNAINISNALRAKMPELQADLQSRFAGAEMMIASDSSTSVSDETDSTINAIILGVVLTVLVLLVFTRNWRSTVIAGVVIPASLIAGFFFMDGSGFTVNAMTLLAYSSALGTLVSNAIILIESALQELRAGKNPEDAAIDGTKKVAVSVLAGVGTNVVVFLPLAFMDGIVGQFMVQFGLTVVYLTLLSLMFSFTLTPMMIAKFLRLTDNKKKTRTKTVRATVVSDNSGATDSASRGWMRRWFDFQIAHPWRVVGLVFVIFIASVQLMKFVGNEFSPSTDANEITITARAPMGATFEKSESIAMQIERGLEQFDEVKSTTVKIGERGLQNITITVELVDASERNISDKLLAQKMLPAIANVADAEIQIRAGEAMSSGISSDLVLNVFGEDDATREAYADQIIKIVNQIPEVQSAVRAQQLPAMETQFVPDQQKMNFWGVQNAYAGTTLRTALFGNDDYKFKENGEEYPIILEFAKPFKTAALFDNVYVNSQKGMVPLSALGTVRSERATPDIRREDKNRYTEIDINIGKSTMGPVQAKIQSELDKIDWAAGYYTQFGGMSDTQAESASEIGKAFMLATILTFMLLAAILNSLAHPFTIATSILTSFAGVFVMMFLSGATMNVGAMLAFVMLVGLVVNNNILVLEPTINRVGRGEDAATAMWAELTDKQNMVLMTSIAVVAGMVPQLWSVDGMKVAMGAVMIGGMLASLLFTFTLTPALFILVERGRTFFARRRHK